MARGLTALAALVVVAGCGRSPVLDRDALESEIPSALAPAFADAITDVECPELIVEGPRTVVCTAAIRDVVIEVSVAISADDRATVSTDAVVLEVAEMEAAAASRLSADLGVETTVGCPGPPIVVSVPESTLGCEAIDDEDGVHPVTFTILSGSGDWELSLG